MPITHSKVLAQPDGADSSKARPSDWNANHVVSLTSADITGFNAAAKAAALGGSLVTIDQSELTVPRAYTVPDSDGLVALVVGEDTEIVFKAGSALQTSANFKWDGDADTLRLGSESAGRISARTNVAEGDGADLVLRGGDGATSGLGGDIQLRGGEGVGAGKHGGYLILSPGDAMGGAIPGGIILVDLPTSDPAVVGQLWNNSGTLKVSAG